MASPIDTREHAASHLLLAYGHEQTLARNTSNGETEATNQDTTVPYKRKARGPPAQVDATFDEDGLPAPEPPDSSSGKANNSAPPEQHDSSSGKTNRQALQPKKGPGKTRKGKTPVVEEAEEADDDDNSEPEVPGKGRTT